MKQFLGKDSKIRLWDKMTFSVNVNAILKSYLNNSEVNACEKDLERNVK